MANENAAQKRLTMDDPVGKEVLDKLAELESAEINASLQLMAIKQEEVKLLAAGRRIEDERHRIFEKLLIDRGMSPQAPATIDQTTGKISLVRPAQPPLQAQQAPAPQAPVQAAPVQAAVPPNGG